MGGEVFYQVTAKEAGEIKKKPALATKLGDGRRLLKMSGESYSIEGAIECVRADLGPEDLEVFLTGAKQIGDSQTPVEYLTIKQVKTAADALAGIGKDLFREAFDQANCACDEDVTEACHRLFADLVEFMQDAAGKKKAVIKTIY